MKTLLLIILLISQVMAITAKDAAFILNAQTDLTKALQIAKNENKSMIVLLVIKDGCNWCEKMINETMKDKRIEEALDNTVIIVTDEGSELAKKFNTKLTPSTYFINVRTGKTVSRQVGFEKPGSFLITIISAGDNIDEEQ